MAGSTDASQHEWRWPTKTSAEKRATRGPNSDWSRNGIKKAARTDSWHRWTYPTSPWEDANTVVGAHREAHYPWPDPEDEVGTSNQGASGSHVDDGLLPPSSNELMQHLRNVIPPQPCWPPVDGDQAPAIGDSPHHATNPAVAPLQPTILHEDTDINKPNARRVSRSPPGLGRVYHDAHTSHTNAPSQHAAPPQPALPPNDTDHDLARTAGIIPHTIRACGAPQQPSSPPIVKDPALAAIVPCQDTSIDRFGSISPRPRGKLHGGDQNLHSNAHPPPQPPIPADWLDAPNVHPTPCLDEPPSPPPGIVQFRAPQVPLQRGDPGRRPARGSDPFNPIRKSDSAREDRSERSPPVGPYIRESLRGTIGGPLEGFGRSSYVVFEVCDPTQEKEEPLLLIWLHGMNETVLIKADYMIQIQTRLQRRTFFLVPTSPEPAADGTEFNWGVSCTTKQNKAGSGHIHGVMNDAFHRSFLSVVEQIAHDIGANDIIVAGYSMGGFGALQMGSFSPATYKAVISIAGYGLGSRELTSSGFRAPQPHSSQVFDAFIQENVPNLALIPAVVILHAEFDCRLTEMLMRSHNRYKHMAETPYL